MAQRVPVSPQRSAKLRCSTRQLGSALDAHRQPHRSRPHAKAVSSLLATQEGSRRCTNIKWQEGAVERAAKEHLLKQKGCCLWFTGLSGSGKSTVACTLEHALLQRGHLTSLLDGDNIRHGLNCNLGFSAEDREENIRRVGEVSKLLVSSGVIVLVSCISPYRADRDNVRGRLGDSDFIEIYMETPLHVCEGRDPKGLYKLAREGKIKNFTGIDDPYEPPPNSEIVLQSHLAAPQEMAGNLLCYLQKHGYLEA